MRFPALIVAVATKVALAENCSDCVVLPWRLAHTGSTASTGPAIPPRCFPDHDSKNAQESEGKAWHFGCFSVTCAQKDAKIPLSNRGYTVKLQNLGSGFCGRTEDQILVAAEPASNSSAMSIWVRCAAFAEVCGESNSELDVEQIFLLVLICVATLVVIVTGILMLKHKRPKRSGWREPTRQWSPSAAAATLRRASGSFTSSLPGVASSSIGPLSNRSGPIPKILIWPPDAEYSPPAVYSPKEEPRRSTEISL
ncbi:unnamed protein product [Cladocopium goreaui]|uniref:Uncharacterized protein n=1 Tax=Cladocopium goreaui TaxID=2562237 RepID=A0A9P1FXV3_9DINO|nr:unnamed protein product [Cladocopium goreaui]|mmetsp:Transcript_3392/g.7944  ORF Transcript_3392/g.7944 Transcript_3392/m.7944 type:complete len:253 (+) Transcript_3392:64-822(+)